MVISVSNVSITGGLIYVWATKIRALQPKKQIIPLYGHRQRSAQPNGTEMLIHTEELAQIEGGYNTECHLYKAMLFYEF